MSTKDAIRKAIIEKTKELEDLRRELANYPDILYGAYQIYMGDSESYKANRPARLRRDYRSASPDHATLEELTKFWVGKENEIWAIAFIPDGWKLVKEDD